MSIERQKEIADVRDELRKLAEQYNQLVTARRERLIGDAKGAFTEYFEKHGYSVESGGQTLRASYKGSWVRLTLPAVSDAPIGAVIRFDVDSDRKAKHLIVGQVAGSSGFSISVREVTTPPDELETAKRSKAELEASIRQIDEVSLEYKLVESSSSSIVRTAPAYAAFIAAVEAFVG